MPDDWLLDDWLLCVELLLDDELELDDDEDELLDVDEVELPDEPDDCDDDSNESFETPSGGAFPQLVTA